MKVKTDLPPKPPYDWVKLIFLAVVHLVMALAIGSWLFGRPIADWTWRSGILGVVWFVLSCTAITAGYHRLFSHPTYWASWPLRLFHLLWGSAAVQGSAMQWAAQHRDHHTFVDGPKDPYSIQYGFWYAHLGWVVRKTWPNYARVPDLARDRLVALQHRWEIPAVLGMGFGLPMLLGALWGEALGALLLVGFVRLVIQWHMTFCVNSAAHYFGDQKHSTANSSRGSWWVSLITWGEAQDHNYHHAHPGDFRTGTRWYDFDPAKWFIYLAVKCKLAAWR